MASGYPAIYNPGHAEIVVSSSGTKAIPRAPGRKNILDLHQDINPTTIKPWRRVTPPYQTWPVRILNDPVPIYIK